MNGNIKLEPTHCYGFLSEVSYALCAPNPKRGFSLKLRKSAFFLYIKKKKKKKKKKEARELISKLECRSLPSAQSAGICMLRDLPMEKMSRHRSRPIPSGRGVRLRVPFIECVILLLFCLFILFGFGGAGGAITLVTEKHGFGL
jgi:hypothetical protein